MWKNITFNQFKNIGMNQNMKISKAFKTSGEMLNTMLLASIEDLDIPTMIKHLNEKNNIPLTAIEKDLVKKYFSYEGNKPDDDFDSFQMIHKVLVIFFKALSLDQVVNDDQCTTALNIFKKDLVSQKHFNLYFKNKFNSLENMQLKNGVEIEAFALKYNRSLIHECCIQDDLNNFLKSFLTSVGMYTDKSIDKKSEDKAFNKIYLNLMNLFNKEVTVSKKDKFMMSHLHKGLFLLISKYFYNIHEHKFFYDNVKSNSEDINAMHVYIIDHVLFFKKYFTDMIFKVSLFCMLMEEVVADSSAKEGAEYHVKYKESIQSKTLDLSLYKKAALNFQNATGASMSSLDDDILSLDDDLDYILSLENNPEYIFFKNSHSYSSKEHPLLLSPNEDNAHLLYL
jgi:hypothetical protein